MDSSASLLSLPQVIECRPEERYSSVCSVGKEEGHSIACQAGS